MTERFRPHDKGRKIKWTRFTGPQLEAYTKIQELGRLYADEVNTYNRFTIANQIKTQALVLAGITDPAKVRDPKKPLAEAKVEKKSL